jgi:hypothetical protein
VSETPSRALLLGAAACGGVAVLLAVSLAARTRDDDLDRVRHLALHATLALGALPAAAAAWLGLAPGAGWLLLLLVGALGFAVYRASRLRGPVGGVPRRLLFVVVVLLGSTAGVAILAGLAARLAPPAPGTSPERSAAIYQLDAGVVTRPLPRCESKLADNRVLAALGARPRLAPGGGPVWFDAETSDGRRQVQRLDRSTGVIECWTCNEPGNNLRPVPSASGVSIVFESDRHLSWSEPTNTELYLARSRAGGLARRITHFPGPDGFPVFHSGGVVVWSRGVNGSQYVVSASLKSGHGALFLGSPGALFNAGTRFSVPLAWSPDARHLAIGAGQPFRPLRVTLLDPATDEALDVAGRVPAGSTAAFSADGGWMMLATSEPRGLAGLAPDSLGFLLARVPDPVRDRLARFRGTRVLVGAPGQPLMELDLGELASWGAPTGIASEPDGTGFVLGQRRPGPDGVEERLVEARLDCS